MRSFICLLFVFVSAASISAQTNFSDDISNPTVITLTDDLTIENTVVNSGSALANADTDFFTIVVPSGLQIDRISLSRYAEVNDSGQLNDNTDAVSFFGVEEGSTLSHNPAGNAQDQADFEEDASGFTLVDANIVGSDLRFRLATADILGVPRRPDPSEWGLDPFSPLPSGSYAFVFQDTGARKIFYELSFETSVIPEPSSFLLLGLAVLISAACFRNRRQMRL
ncbi:MAG: PEP-CTERM sorting domain-containing protein [Planctomycetota bacterium]